MDIKEISKKAKAIGCCMMTTLATDKTFNSRPMSTIFSTDDNLKHLYFFCVKNSEKITELEQNKNISLDFQSAEIGSIHFAGVAEITDKLSEMQPLWDKKLEAFWPDGVETSGIALIKVQIKQIRYWIGGQSDTINY